MSCILLIGNIADGHTFVGPFDNEVIASYYGDQTGAAWMIAELEEPGMIDFPDMAEEYTEWQ